MGDDQRRAAGDDRPAEHLPARNESRVDGAERDQMPAQRMILAIEINAVERLLERIFVERGAEVIGDLLRCIELHFFTGGNEGVAEFTFENAHRERSHELRFPSQRRVELSQVLPV